VGHYHAGHGSLACGADQAHHRIRVDRVQRSRRLIGQQQAALPHHRAGDRNPLPFSAGQLIREPGRPVGQAQVRQRRQRRGARCPRGHSVELQRQGNVLGRGQPGQQVEVLEHVPDRAPPQPGSFVA